MTLPEPLGIAGGDHAQAEDDDQYPQQIGFPPFHCLVFPLTDNFKNVRRPLVLGAILDELSGARPAGSNARVSDPKRKAKFMPHWLMKSEPDELSIHHLAQLKRARWDGVRNYQARNFLRAMQTGDLFLFYHSSCPQPGVAGIGRILGGCYPDPSALMPDSHYFDVKASAERNPWSALEIGRASCRERV